MVSPNALTAEEYAIIKQHPVHRTIDKFEQGLRDSHPAIPPSMIYAYAALKSGVHPKIVSERLGHASINITLDTYSHVLPGLQEAAAAAIDAALLQPDESDDAAEVR
jgi:integrase